MKSFPVALIALSFFLFAETSDTPVEVETWRWGLAYMQNRFAAPVRSGWLTGACGWLAALDGADKRPKRWWSPAVEFQGEKELKVFAVDAGQTAVEGSTVTVTHPDGCQTVYRDLSNIQIKDGDNVERGQLLAEIKAEAPKVHIEFIKGAQLRLHYADLNAWAACLRPLKTHVTKVVADSGPQKSVEKKYNEHIIDAFKYQAGLEYLDKYETRKASRERCLKNGEKKYKDELVGADFFQN